MLGLWITLGVIGGLLLIFGLYIGSTYNSLVRKRNNVQESFSTMDVCMKKRYDLVPNLVATVKGYMKHESETFERIVNARNRAISATTIEETKDANSELTAGLKSLFALTESYPDLKANQSFLDLQTQLQNVEAEIGNSRRYFNACVKDYNNKVQMFPSSIIAKWFKFTTTSMFELESAEERKNVKVEF